MGKKKKKKKIPKSHEVKNEIYRIIKKNKREQRGLYKQTTTRKDIQRNIPETTMKKHSKMQ